MAGRPSNPRKGTSKKGTAASRARTSASARPSAGGSHRRKSRTPPVSSAARAGTRLKAGHGGRGQRRDPGDVREIAIPEARERGESRRDPGAKPPPPKP